MGDAQLSHLDAVRSSLLERDDEFRQLVTAHHRLDEQIRRLSSFGYLTHQQQLEESALKKQKLALKDRIETFVRRHAPASPPETRVQ